MTNDGIEIESGGSENSASESGASETGGGEIVGGEIAPVKRPESEPAKSELALVDAQKRLVIESLAMGRSMKETAEIFGIGRATIYRWIKYDPAFRAAHNQWQNEVQQNIRSRLMALANGAVDAVADGLARKDSKLGLKVLDKLKAFEPAPVEKPTEPSETRAEINLEKMRQRVEIEMQRDRLESERDTVRVVAAMSKPIASPWDAPKKKKRRKKVEDGKVATKKTRDLPADAEARRIAEELFGKGILEGGTDDETDGGG